MSRPSRAFPVAICATLLAALLPVGWLRWTTVAADIVNVPLQPVLDGGVRLGRLLRPPGGLRAEESQELRRFHEELDATRALLHGARLTIETLQGQIRELEVARRFHGGAEVDLVYARVTGRSPDRAQGPIRVNAGRRDGVLPRTTIAVYRGAHLIGRVADEVGHLSCRVVPITDRATGLMEVILLSADDPVSSLGAAPRIQLAPDGRGGLVGDLDRSVAVGPGDVARLADPLWPDTAQGMIVGTVDGVAPKDLQPLMNTVTIRPVYHAHQVSSVILRIERVGHEALGGGGGDEEGRP